MIIVTTAPRIKFRVAATRRLNCRNMFCRLWFAPPDRFSGFRLAVVLSIVKRWLFGKREYAYPLLRWLNVALTRVGLLVIALSVVLHLAWSIAWFGVALVLVSIVVDLLNRHLMRTRRRDAGSRSASAG